MTSMVDRVLRLFATPHCPDCKGSGVIEGQVFDDGLFRSTNNDRICDCVPQITLTQRT